MGDFGSQQVRIEPRGRRAGGGHTFTCSAQSILNAMDSFLHAVRQMNDTILVPSKLRDMHIRDELQSGLFAVDGSQAGRAKFTADYEAFYTQNASGLATAGRMTVPPAALAARRLERPAPLLNCDPHQFYSMLGDLRKELLWGPASGHSTIYTQHTYSGTNAIGIISSTASPLPIGTGTIMSNAGQSMNGSQASLNKICENWRQSNVSPNCNGNCKTNVCLRRSESSSVASSSGVSSVSLSINGTGSSSGASSGSSTASSTTGSNVHNSNNVINCSANNNTAQQIIAAVNNLTNATLTSRDSNQKLASKMLDCDLDSELDSMLTDRTDCCAEQSLHLASAFKHHLQGLHTILQQLTSSADYLTLSYQLEVDEN